MKAKFVFAGIITATVLLIGIAAWLTNSLFNMSISDKSPQTGIMPEQPTPTTPETIAEIEIKTPARPQPAAKEQKQPQSPITVDEASPNLIASAAEQKQPGIGTITIIRGKASAISKDGKSRQLSEKARIFLNEKIETEQNSRLRIQFDDESTIFMGENTVTILDEYIYSPTQKDDAKFLMRFLKGTCRVITGAIVRINPERFTVRTKMASIGIRGCDLAFNSTFAQDDIYVIELSKGNTVRIETTSDGSQMINALTGEDLPINPTVKTIIDIKEPQHVVSVIKGIGTKESTIDQDDIRKLIEDTSHLSPARYDIQQTPSKVQFTLMPKTRTTTALPPDKAK